MLVDMCMYTTCFVLVVQSFPLNLNVGSEKLITLGVSVHHHILFLDL